MSAGEGVGGGGGVAAAGGVGAGVGVGAGAGAVGRGGSAACRSACASFAARIWSIARLSSFGSGLGAGRGGVNFERSLGISSVDTLLWSSLILISVGW